MIQTITFHLSKTYYYLKSNYKNINTNTIYFHAIYLCIYSLLRHREGKPGERMLVYLLEACELRRNLDIKTPKSFEDIIELIEKVHVLANDASNNVAMVKNERKPVDDDEDEPPLAHQYVAILITLKTMLSSSSTYIY